MEDKINILLVDDIPENLTALESILSSPTYNLVMATSGRAALREVLHTKFALILLDVKMPEIDGFEVAHIIHERETTRYTPVILLTAAYNQESLLKAYEEGAVDIIFKPVNPAILRTKVNVFVELFQKTREIERAKNELDRVNKELETRVIQRTKEINDTLLKLDEKNKELQDFLYIASHDLQEPLRKVQGFGDILKKRYAEILGKEGADYIDRMQNASGRMNKLLEALLLYSRVTTQVRPFENIDLRRLVEDVVTELNFSIEKVKGKVVIGKLPVIEADGLQMHHVFQNLISNAVKFRNPDKQLEIRIFQVTDDVPENSIELAVEDNGIGIDKKYSDRVFEAFQKLHPLKEYEGTGIGLTICKKVIERHKGTISFTSKTGEGTRFIIKLPLNKNNNYDKKSD